MKIALTGMALLDANFRHNVDPLATPVTGPHPYTDVPMEIGLLKGEVPHTYAVKLRAVIESPAALYALSVTYAVLLTVDPEGAELPSDFDNQIMVTGASMAFPYCREVITNLTGRSRFGPIWVNPTSFKNLFATENPTPLVAQE